MHDFHHWLTEMVRNKTDLTQWLLTIKRNPKDPHVYMVLADFLEETGRPEDAALANMFRLALQAQDEARRTGRKGNDFFDRYEQHKREFNRILQEKGYNVRWRTIENPNRSVVPNSGTILNTYRGNKMASTLSTGKDDEHINNVAWHDLDDRNHQLFALATIASNIFNHRLVVGDKIDYRGECNARNLLDSFLNREMRDRLINGENENYNPIRRFEEAISDIRKLIQATFDCCHHWEQSDRLYLLDVMRDFYYELEGYDWDHSIHVYEALLWTAGRFAEALEIEDCQRYQQAIRLIMRRIRNRESWAKTS